MIASGGRVSPALPLPLGWMGPGRTAFAGAAGTASPGRIALARGPGDLAAFGGGGDPEFLRSLAAYFAGGGGPCVVVNLPPLDQVPPERRAALWLGEDGGPGYRTGLSAILDREDVGTIAVPGLRDGPLRRRLVSFVEKQEGLFLVLDTQPRDEGEAPPACDRAAEVGEWSRVPGGPAAPGGPHLAELEAADFSEDRPERALRALGGRGHPTLGKRFPSVEAWRAWEGLRRSIDQGTRWIVFEPNGAHLRRRVEREVGAFLERLFRLGLLEGKTAEEAYRVRCEPSRSAERPAEGLLVLQVDVRLKGNRRRSPMEAAPAGEGSAARSEGPPERVSKKE